MILEQTGATYQSSKFAKALLASEAKVGKSCFLIASALGVLPWQKRGGIVDDPRNLHVITFDANALGGIQRFLVETCGAPKEALGFKVYNLQDSLRKICENDIEYDMTLYGEIMACIEKMKQTAKGTPVLHISSLTGAAKGLERGVVGPPTGKGYSDISKWKMISHQLHEMQNFSQVDKWHCLWEAHIDKSTPLAQGKDAPPAKESLAIPGEAGRTWTYNVEQVFRIRRTFGQRFEKTQCDQVYLDTRSDIGSGRNFNEALEAKEADMTVAFEKLGLQVGRWGSK